MIGRDAGGLVHLGRVIIEKDYYVNEVLRVISATAGDRVIFKGGTSLSKRWGLIQRFSEDIDIFLDPLAFQPPLGKNGIDRELKQGSSLFHVGRMKSSLPAMR